MSAHGEAPRRIVDQFSATDLTKIVTELHLDMGAKRSSRPKKHEDVLVLARKHLDSGKYLDTRHATERKQQRQITRPEVFQVLRGGYHEKRKDEFKEEYNAWNYAIRGKTIDKRDLRICVSFDKETGMLIITAIDLDL